MKISKKRKQILTLALAIICAMSAIPTFASNDNIGYSFSIKSSLQNTYSDKRYRQTTDTSNKWKVNMAYSEEGVGTMTVYWLSLFNSTHERVSGTHSIKQGTGDHLYNATYKASQTDVCLSAENNNNSLNTYTVSGYWDEETN